jgi:hypothetical protein
MRTEATRLSEKQVTNREEHRQHANGSSNCARCLLSD